MELHKNACTAFLVVVAVVVLAVTHEFLSLDRLSVDTQIVAFEFSSPNGGLLPVLAVALLLGFLACHIATHCGDIISAYRHGYRYAPRLWDRARMQIMEVTGGIVKEPPVGNIHATLSRRAWDFGQWSRPDGALSLIIFTPDRHIHRHALFRGILHAMQPSLWMRFYIPIALALWALISMVA
jgi:hypothetical protein